MGGHQCRRPRGRGWLVEGIWFDGPTNGQAELTEKLLPLVLVALIMGLVSSFVEPVLKLLSLPVIVLTIGLFLFVVNALMLMLTGWIAEQAASASTSAASGRRCSDRSSSPSSPGSSVSCPTGTEPP